MNRTARLLAVALATTLTVINTSVAQILPGNLAVLRVGDGAAALSNAATPFAIIPFSPAGVAGTAIQITSSGATPLTVSGTSASDGSLSITGNTLTFAGYTTAAGTAAVTGTTAAAVPRAFGTVDTVSGTYNYGTTFGTAFSATNVRSAVTTSGGVYAVGANTGVVLAPGTTVSTTSANNRVINSVGSDLVFSTGAGTRGLYTLSGNPTAAGSVAVLTVATGATSSPYGFSFSPDGNTVYIADDSANTTGGIQKYTRPNAATAFALATTFGTGVANIGARGISVDYSTANPTIYATTAEASNNRLISFQDVTGTQTGLLNLSSAGTNLVYRGVAFAPVPEPATVVGLSALGLGAAGFVRRRRAARLKVA